MITDIRDGRRPYRPIDASQLQDPIWDVITTGWSHEPEKRCELSVMRDTIVTSSQQGSLVPRSGLGSGWNLTTSLPNSGRRPQSVWGPFTMRR